MVNSSFSTAALAVALLLHGIYITAVHFEMASSASSASIIVQTETISKPGDDIKAPQESSEVSVERIVESARSTVKPLSRTLFNPWRDFVFKDIAAASSADNTTAEANATERTIESPPLYYSSHSCLAADDNTRRIDSVSRTCHFRNLYYHIRTKTWHYYPNPTEREVFKRGDVPMTDMDTALWHVRENIMEKAATAHSEPWRPTVHLDDELPLPRGAAKLVTTTTGKTPVFVLYRGSMPNYGHLIWDDSLSIFSQLDLLDLADDDTLLPVPFIQDPIRYVGGSYCHSNSPHTYSTCVKFFRKLYPNLWNVDTDCSGDVVRSNNWLQGNAAIGKWVDRGHEACGDYRDNLTNTVEDSRSAAEYVVVPHVTVGSGRLALFSCYGECTLGRGPQLYRFRNYIMTRILGEVQPQVEPIKGYITFSLAYGASRGKGEVSFFEEEIEAARTKYGEEAVKAVDFANMTLKEQGILIGNSAALFTNHGGGSASTVFLPKGSSAFVYWRSQQRDHEFYSSVGYFRTQWIGYEKRRSVKRTMRLLDMELQKTGILYPGMLPLNQTGSAL